MSAPVGNANHASRLLVHHVDAHPHLRSLQTKGSNPFGTAVGNSNGASGAPCGCPSASPFFAHQSWGPFGTAVGNSNGPFGVSNGSTSAPSVFPFGSGAATNAGPFGQSSSIFTGFGYRTNASTFGQRTSIFGGFGEAATSTTPLFGHPGPSFNTFRGASSTTPASTLQPSIFPRGGGGPVTADSSCGGTRAPYRPTPAEENQPDRFVSISAMNCYCNKSHEELRSEEYKQTRNGGPSSAAHVPGVSNPFSVSSRSPFQPDNTFEWLPPPREPLSFTFTRSSENPIQRTDPSSSLGSDKNRTTPVQISPVQTSVAQTLPSPTPTTTTNPAVTTSHVSPSAAGVLGGESINLSKSAPPTPTNTAPSGSAPLLDFFSQVIQDSSSIPKGLEIIAQHLGFNPWKGKNNLQDSQAGHILLCEDASDDPDIFSLAEFAVEQHNAMDKDGQVELLKVTAACLEAVDGGRYHIILDAEPPASSIVRVACFYAAVLRKNTDRPTPLIVLERWLPSSYWSCKK